VGINVKSEGHICAKILYLLIQVDNSLSDRNSFEIAALVETVHSRDLIVGKPEVGNLPKGRAKKAMQVKPEILQLLVPAHMMVTDVSHVKQATLVFKGLIFCILQNTCDYLLYISSFLFPI
jgi:hypothetical protein